MAHCVNNMCVFSGSTEDGVATKVTRGGSEVEETVTTFETAKSSVKDTWFCLIEDIQPSDWHRLV